MDNITFEQVREETDGETLRRWWHELNELNAQLKGKIADAKASVWKREPIDQDWYARLQGKQHIVAALLQAVQLRTGEVRVEQNQNHQTTVERYFIDAAKLLLPGETVAQLFDIAKRKAEEASKRKAEKEAAKLSDPNELSW